MPKPGGYIYAIGAVGTSWVKIGSTRAGIDQRLKILQTGQPFPLRILATMSVETDVQRIEKQVHAFLAAERQRGEWFEVSIDTPALERLVVRAVQYVAEQEEQQRLARRRKEEAQRLRAEAQYARTSMQTLGDRIRQARERVGLSQIELARRIGLSKNAMNSIETGDADPRASRIVAIAQELGVSTDVLLLGTPATDSREPQPTTKHQQPRKAAPVA